MSALAEGVTLSLGSCNRAGRVPRGRCVGGQAREWGMTFRLGVALRRLAFLCIAGAAGCAIERADDCVKASSYPWSTGTGLSRCYAPVVLHHDHMRSLPIADGAWRIEIERPTWEVLAPAASRTYHGGPLLLPNPGVLVPDNALSRSTDPSSPSPSSGR